MCLVALVAAHAPGAAANLCTIDHVERTPVGVNVYFSATGILTIYHSGPKSRVVVADPKARDAVGGDRLGPFRGVALVVGDRVLIPLGDAYHTCELKVLATDGKITIDITQWDVRVGGFGGDMGEGQVQSIATE
jgi:hypothetical protein